MKVLFINGSPHADGCTATALNEIAKTLAEENIEHEIVNVGMEKVRSCIGCGKCANNLCVFDDDIANRLLEKISECDALIVGSPVYFSSPNGLILSLFDRMFHAAGSRFYGKPAAAVVSARRAGTTASLDVLHKYFHLGRMPIVPSQYWSMVHGNKSEDVLQDEEGLQIMRTLGRNMAWLLRCIEAGKNAGVDFPAPEQPRKITNFIR